MRMIKADSYAHAHQFDPLPEALIDEARKSLGFTSKTDTVVYALREVVRRSRSVERRQLPSAMKRKGALLCRSRGHRVGRRVILAV